MTKKNKRTLIYAAIIGGTAALALTFYTISQFEKAKYKASETWRLSSQAKIKSTSGDLKQWWTETNEYFVAESKKNSTAYIVTSIPAYVFSIGTLVAFGLVLKHAEKVKEKEENEVA